MDIVSSNNRKEQKDCWMEYATYQPQRVVRRVRHCKRLWNHLPHMWYLGDAQKIARLNHVLVPVSSFSLVAPPHRSFH
jgi:hypothetical protein